MFDYLQQFNNLPKDLRDKVSSPIVMTALVELEKKYQVDLAMAVMKIMIKSLTVNNLPAYFISEFGLGQSVAENLTKELTVNVFLNAANYLGLEREAKALNLDTDINLIIREAGIVLPSSELVGRFKNILSTYLRGVRSKIAARDALAKSAELGGLNLASAEIDRVFKICEQKTFTNLNISSAPVIPPAPQSRLDKIVASADSVKMSEEYSLKQAIASGQVKKLETPPAKSLKLDTSHELPTPEKELSFPLMEKIERIAAHIETAVQIAPTAPAAITKSSSIATPTIAPTTIAISPSSVPNIPVLPVPTSIEDSGLVTAPTMPAPPVSRIFKPEQQIQEPVKTGLFGQSIKVSPEPKVAPVISPVISHPTPPVPPIKKQVADSRPIFAPSIAKQVMHDIKPMPKVMGPLEELQFLDLLNFRRLGKTPAEITAKIFSKVKLLEADGYDKMVLGVRAWRQSPVNRLYLKMVQEAINKGLTIKDFAVEAQKDINNYLTLEEIEAILSLNSQLVF